MVSSENAGLTWELVPRPSNSKRGIILKFRPGQVKTVSKQKPTKQRDKRGSHENNQGISTLKTGSVFLLLLPGRDSL